MKAVQIFAAIALLIGLFASTQASITSEADEFPIRVSGDTQGWRWTANVAVKGQQVAGRLYVDGAPDLQGLAVEGTIHGSDMELNVVRDGGVMATFSGAVNGLNVSGSYAMGIAGREAGDLEGTVATEAAVPPPPDDIAEEPPRSRAPLVSTAFTLPVDLKVSGDAVGASSLSELGRVLGGPTPTPCGNCLVNSANDLDLPEVEPEIAADRYGNPNRLIGGYMFIPPNGLSFVEWRFSTDRGKNWSSTGSLNGAYTRSADPVLDIDVGGRPFLAFVGLNAFQNPCSVAALNQLGIRYSTSGTGTSLPSTTIIANSNNSSAAFHDKPWLAINKLFSPYVNYVYVSWTLLTNNCSQAQILLNHSANNGASFPGFPAIVSDGNNGTGSSIAIGTDNGINVAWWRISGSGQEQIAYDQCAEQANGSLLCGTDQVVATISPNVLPLDSLGSPYLPGINIKANSLPSLAVDSRPGGDGDLFAVWVEYRSGNADVYFSRKPSGSNWLPKTAVAATSTDEFFPTIGVGDDHALRIFYYRRVGTGSDNRFNVFVRKSTDDGLSWTAPAQINNGGDLTPTTQIDLGNGTFFIGDYIGLDVNEKAGDPSGTEVPLIWTDSRRLIGAGPNHQLDIFTAVGC